MFEILFNDEKIIAVNKPAGILVHKTGIDKNETRFLIQELRDQIGKKVWPVHRLDKPTSGLILFSFDKKILANLSAQFTEKTIVKKYIAIVRGFGPDLITIDHPIKDKAIFKNQNKDKIPFKDAVTKIKTIKNFELPFATDKYSSSRYSLIEATPLTGRKHQIRRHLKHISHPIIGDTAYGKSTHNNLFFNYFGVKRLLLHALSLSFNHPVSKERITLTSKIPADFEFILNKVANL